MKTNVKSAETARRKTYKRAKEAARMFAIDAQDIISESALSYGEVAEIQYTLLRLGKRLGLLSEFRENGLC